MAGFVHLNVHSHYSILHALCHIDRLVKRCRELSMDALALTDNGNMFGCREFHSACKKAGVKPIVGMTAYVTVDHRDRKPQEAKSGRRLVLLARDHEGYQSLCRLSSAGYIDGFYMRPRIDRALLEKHIRGLLLLSGGIGSEIHDHLLMGDAGRAAEAAAYYRDLAGPDNYFLEIQRTGIPELAEVEASALRLAEDLGLPCVATNDVHYVSREQHRAHEVLMCIGQVKTMKDASRPRFSSDEFYLKSPAEMQALFSDRPDLLDNTLRVAERCSLVFPKREYHLPVFAPPGGEGVDAYFDAQCRAGLAKRYGDPIPAGVSKRYEEERGVIMRTGFPAYFLIVADFIRKAREMGVPVGPGRGSAAGSIVAYALEITDVDPLRFDLLFERFLNEERVSMPDIDIDFCQERRHEVIEYVVQRYGREKVASIITFGTLGAKAVVRDVSRVFGVPLPDVDRVCKEIPDRLASDSEEAEAKVSKVTLKKALEASAGMRKAVEDIPGMSEVIDIALVLENTVRNVSTHAAGVVISDRDLVEYLPLYKIEETISTQFPMKTVEECGMLKMDFLGLQNLTVIAKAVRMIAETRGIALDVRKLPLDDAETYALFQRGDGMGVFQLESEGMQKLLKRIVPDRFEDIIAVLALYRPGPLGSGMDRTFVDRKHGRERVSYPHPLCESELKETYGGILYQEQVMRLTNRLAGFTLKEADSLRKAMGKKDAEIMMSYTNKFLDGARKNGLPESVARGIWNDMVNFAKYGFNKSHSAAYAFISYQTAYLKAHFPEEFMAALMTCDVRNKDKIALFKEECGRMGIGVLPPHVNESNYDFRVVGGRIRYGLGGVKGVGAPAVEAVVEARAKAGPFSGFEEFCERVDLGRCGKTALEALIKCGALDDLGANRRQMFDGLPEVMEMANNQKRKVEGDQLLLFAVDGPAAAGSRLKEAAEWSEREKLAYEKEVLELYLSSHPLASVEDTLRFFSSHTVTQLSVLDNDAEVCLGGIVQHCSSRYYKPSQQGQQDQKNPQKKAEEQQNKKMFRFQLEDLTGAVECVYFCPKDDKYGHLFVDDSILFIAGRVSRMRGLSVKAVRVYPLEEAELRLSGGIALHLDRASADEDFLKRLSGVLAKHRGELPVHLLMRHSGGELLKFRLGDRFSVRPDRELFLSLGEMMGRERVELFRGRNKLPGGRW